jgi:hypothetical protein
MTRVFSQPERRQIPKEKQVRDIHRERSLHECKDDQCKQPRKRHYPAEPSDQKFDYARAIQERRSYQESRESKEDRHSQGGDARVHRKALWTEWEKMSGQH